MAPQAPYAAPAPNWASPALGGHGVSQRYSSAMIATGAVLIGLGSALAISGAGVLAAGTTRHYDYTPCYASDLACDPVKTNDTGMVAGGAIMVVVGTLGLAVGIPVLATGMRKVVVQPDAVSLVPEVKVGGTSGALEWKF
jgi:hypothetical protein